MKINERELTVFRAIVKGIGVYQIVNCLSDLLYVAVEMMGIRQIPIGDPSRQGEYLAYAAFHFCMAFFLLGGTDFFCRMAFPSPISGGGKEDLPNPALQPSPASGTSVAEQPPRLSGRG